MSNLVFDSITPIEEPVQIAGRDYVLREATEETAEQYRRTCMEGVRMEDGKVIGVSGGISEVQSLLVGQCLHEVNNEGKALRQVGRKVVRSWPSRIVRQLFDRVKEISALDEDESEDVLIKQQAEIAKKLERIRSGGTVGKNSQTDTMHDSE